MGRHHRAPHNPAPTSDVESDHVAGTASAKSHETATATATATTTGVTSSEAAHDARDQMRQNLRARLRQKKSVRCGRDRQEALDEFDERVQIQRDLQDKGMASVLRQMGVTDPRVHAVMQAAAEDGALEDVMEVYQRIAAIPGYADGSGDGELADVRGSLSTDSVTNAATTATTATTAGTAVGTNKRSGSGKPGRLQIPPLLSGSK